MTTHFTGTLASNILATLAFAGMDWLFDASPQAVPSNNYLSYRLLLYWGESMLTGIVASEQVFTGVSMRRV